MRLLAAVFAMAFLSAGGACAASPADAPVAAIHAFMDAFDRGDMKTAAAGHEPDAAIIDEVPPHQWHGSGAFEAWVADLTKASAAAGQTDEQVILGRTIRAEVNGDTAYVVLEATFAYKQHGKPMREPAQMVFAMKKEADGWKISAWAWTGTIPH